MSNNTPIIWDQLMKQEKYNKAEQQVFMQQAAKHGLVNGLSIPIRSVSGETAVFSLVVDQYGSEGINILENLIPYAYTFSLHMFERYNTLLSSESPIEVDERLTDREQQCIFWACEGKTSWEISRILEISERTVIFHLNNIVNKLGATNRQHAVAIAISRGMVQPNI